MVGYPEVILVRLLLASESEFSWKIAASRVKHRIADRPSPDKSVTGFCWIPIFRHPSAVFSSRIFIYRGYDQPRHPSILQSSFSRPFAALWRRLIVGRDGEHSSEPAPFRRPFLDLCFLSTAGFVEWRSAGSAILPSLAGRGGGDVAPVSR